MPSSKAPTTIHADEAEMISMVTETDTVGIDDGVLQLPSSVDKLMNLPEEDDEDMDEDLMKDVMEEELIRSKDLKDFKFSCPFCKKVLTKKGYRNSIRMVYDLDDVAYVIIAQLECASKPLCSGYDAKSPAKFGICDTRLLTQLPLYVQEDLAVLMSTQSGITRQLRDFIKPLLRSFYSLYDVLYSALGNTYRQIIGSLSIFDDNAARRGAASIIHITANHIVDEKSSKDRKEGRNMEETNRSTLSKDQHLFFKSVLTKKGKLSWPMAISLIPTKFDSSVDQNFEDAGSREQGYGTSKSHKANNLNQVRQRKDYKGVGEKKNVKVAIGTLLCMNEYKEVLSYASLMTLKNDELKYHLSKLKNNRDCHGLGDPKIVFPPIKEVFPEAIAFQDLAHIENRIFETFKRSSSFHGQAMQKLKACFYTKKNIDEGGKKFVVTAMQVPIFIKSELEAFQNHYSKYDLFTERTAAAFENVYKHLTDHDCLSWPTGFKTYIVTDNKKKIMEIQGTSKCERIHLDMIEYFFKCPVSPSTFENRFLHFLRKKILSPVPLRFLNGQHHRKESRISIAMMFLRNFGKGLKEEEDPLTYEDSSVPAASVPIASVATTLVPMAFAPLTSVSVELTSPHPTAAFVVTTPLTSAPLAPTLEQANLLLSIPKHCQATPPSPRSVHQLQENDLLDLQLCRDDESELLSPPPHFALFDIESEFRVPPSSTEDNLDWTGRLLKRPGPDDEGGQRDSVYVPRKRQMPMLSTASVESRYFWKKRTFLFLKLTSFNENEYKLMANILGQMKIPIIGTNPELMDDERKLASMEIAAQFLKQYGNLQRKRRSDRLFERSFKQQALKPTYWVIQEFVTYKSLKNHKIPNGLYYPVSLAEILLALPTSSHQQKPWEHTFYPPPRHPSLPPLQYQPQLPDEMHATQSRLPPQHFHQRRSNEMLSKSMVAAANGLKLDSHGKSIRAEDPMADYVNVAGCSKKGILSLIARTEFSGKTYPLFSPSCHAELDRIIYFPKVWHEKSSKGSTSTIVELLDNVFKKVHNIDVLDLLRKLKKTAVLQTRLGSWKLFAYFGKKMDIRQMWIVKTKGLDERRYDGSRDKQGLHGIKTFFTLCGDTTNAVNRNLTFLAYVRKSVDDKADNRSLDDQIAMIKKWGSEKGFNILPRHFSDLASGFLATHAMLWVSFGILKRQNFVSVSEEGLVFGPIANESEEVSATTHLLVKCLFAEIERLSAMKRTKDHSTARRQQEIGQSRYSPFGFLFAGTFGNSERYAFESTVLKDRTEENGLQEPLRLVPHNGGDASGFTSVAVEIAKRLTDDLDESPLMSDDREMD
ncbi:hypothetical protein BC829DRAFT_418716 [Chytridium lagenaria]|nr:hypothetical protein BC829DRAFT_418716 [Chytridium lagenaria]